MGNTILINKANGNDIVALAEQPLRYVVTTGRVLIVGATYLLTIDIGDIGIKEGAEIKAGRHSCLLLVDMNVLTKPDAADNTTAIGIFRPFQRELVNGSP